MRSVRPSELCEAQQEKLKALKDQAATIDEQRARLKRIAAGLAPLDAQDEATAMALRQANAERTRVEDALAAIDAREAELQRLEALSQKLARKAELAARLHQLSDFRQRAAASEAALKLATIDDAVIKSLEDHRERGSPHPRRAGSRRGACHNHREARRRRHAQRHHRRGARPRAPSPRR